MGAFILVEFKEPIVLTNKLTASGWLSPSGWMTVIINVLLIFFIMKLYSNAKTNQSALGKKLEEQIREQSGRY